MLQVKPRTCAALTNSADAVVILSGVESQNALESVSGITTSSVGSTSVPTPSFCGQILTLGYRWPCLP